MPQMTATVAFPYNGKSLKAGEEFEASDRDARTLNLARKAKPKGSDLDYNTRAIDTQPRRRGRPPGIKKTTE